LKTDGAPMAYRQLSLVAAKNRVIGFTLVFSMEKKITPVRNSELTVSLSITLLSPDVVYQSADFRLTDLRTKQPRDFVSQKAIVLNQFRWTALVTFVGIGHTGQLDVAEWLASRTTQIAPDAPSDELGEALLEANAWLAPLRGRPFHTFTVAAFVGVSPRAMLVSNFESLHARPLTAPRQKLELTERTYTKPAILVTGQPGAVSNEDRQRLLHLLRDGRTPREIHEALAQVNSRASRRNITISPACFTTHVDITGQGEAISHGLDEDREYQPSFAHVRHWGLSLRPARDEQGRQKPIRMVGMSFARQQQTEEFHRVQLRLKPEDPNTHNNYGAFLIDVRNDAEGAASAYRKALELDPNHALALGNLASLLWKHHGDLDGAERLLSKALSVEPTQSLNRAKFGEFLWVERQNPSGARRVYREGLTLNPEDETLLRSYATLSLRNGEYDDAAELYRQYVDLRPDDIENLADYATALHAGGADADLCIALYRQVLTTNPASPAVLVNLAQLLFCQGSAGDYRDREARELLDQVLALDAEEGVKLEAWFLRYAHSPQDRGNSLWRLRRMIEEGTRSPSWSFACNVARARREGHPEQELVAALADVIGNRSDVRALSRFTPWSALD
jgi:Flp pilus assembly protein TadD